MSGDPTKGREVFVPKDCLVVSRELVRLAVQIALEPPLRRSRGWGATVGWDTVEALRAELEAHHINWKTHHRANRTKENEG